jgi:flagellar biosynthesis protein FlhA
VSSGRLGQVGVPAAVVAIVVLMVVPLPSIVLDILISANISFSVLILLVSMKVEKPLDFSVFPSLLLVATLFRLALNVSATRLVLLHGYAGTVIESFGHFVVGGSIIVGLVIFLILIVIQFIVITNGAGRVAEVAARFTLDAMPGKQMAIDAEVNAGTITRAEAQVRRREVAAEADFYGAMDGASKFVKGDAIAAIVITSINLVGGMIVGVVQHHLSISQAVSTYSLLSVGDGLVSQIPALLLSISTGLIVTRAATEADMGSDVLAQLGRQFQAVRIAGVAVALLAVIPGLPKVPFLIVGGALVLISMRSANKAKAAAEAVGDEPEATGPAPDSPEGLAQEMRVEPLELEVAFDLVSLVDPGRGGDLLDRVKALRKKTALELGIVVPLVRTRDNLDLPPSTYAIRIQGVEVARGEAYPNAVLVIGDGLDLLPGTPTHEPVFGLDAKWVPGEFRRQAEAGGGTVVDPSSVITTHLAEVVRTNAARLLGRQDVKALVDLVKTSDPVVLDDLNTAQIGLNEVQRVLRDLLDEGVNIRNLVRICEVLSDRGKATKDPEQLVEAVRQSLGPAISSAHAVDGRLPVITFDPSLQQSLLEVLRTGDNGSFLALDSTRAEGLVRSLTAEVRRVEETGESPVVVCSAPLRSALRRLTRSAIPQVPILSYPEIGAQLTIENTGVVSLADATV